jgi:hypothetical protein
MARFNRRFVWVVGLAAAAGVGAAGCQGGGRNPIAPNVATGLTLSPYGGMGVPLIPEPGTAGGGRLNDPQIGKPGWNSFELNISVHGAPADTDLFVQFVADIDPATRGDGVCPAMPPAFPLGVVHTSAGGSVSTHVKFPVPEGAFFGTFDSGEQADFRWRVVNASGTFDVRTPCVVLEGK